MRRCLVPSGFKDGNVPPLAPRIRLEVTHRQEDNVERPIIANDPAIASPSISLNRVFSVHTTTSGVDARRPAHPRSSRPDDLRQPCQPGLHYARKRESNRGVERARRLGRACCFPDPY